MKFLKRKYGNGNKFEQLYEWIQSNKEKESFLKVAKMSGLISEK